MKKYKTEFKWAFIFTIAALLWMAFEKLLGWHSEKIAVQSKYTNIFTLFFILIYALALLDKRKELGGVITWKQSFISGAILTVMVTLLTPLAQWITHALISPEYFPNAIKYSVENGIVEQTMAERYFNMGNYIVLGSIYCLVFGLIITAIIAVFVKRKMAV